MRTAALLVVALACSCTIHRHVTLLLGPDDNTLTTGFTCLGSSGLPLLAAGYTPSDQTLRFNLVVDGLRVAIKEVPRGDADDLLRELAYDGRILQRPAVWQRPWFWIAVGGAAIAIAAGIVAATYQRPLHTSAGF